MQARPYCDILWTWTIPSSMELKFLISASSRYCLLPLETDNFILFADNEQFRHQSDDCISIQDSFQLMSPSTHTYLYINCDMPELQWIIT